MSNNFKTSIKKKSNQWWKRILLFTLFSAILLIIGQLIKYYLVANHAIDNKWIYQSAWLGIKIKLNKSILWKNIQINSFTTIIILQSLVIISLGIIIFWWRKKWISLILILIFFGGLGNFINRLWYSPWVIDYLSLKINEIIYFNLEDLMILVGIIILNLFIITKIIIWIKTETNNYKNKK